MDPAQLQRKLEVVRLKAQDYAINEISDLIKEDSVVALYKYVGMVSARMRHL